jgi:hypothetical protein
MREPVHKYMRVGIVHFMIYPELIAGAGDFLGTLAPLVSDPLFEVVEVGMVRDSSTIPKMSTILLQAGV